MLNLFVAGVLVFLVSFLGYRSWTRPEREEPPSGYALGTIRGTQFGMVLGSIAMIVGLIGFIIQAI
jgi:hypothetical protein